MKRTASLLFSALLCAASFAATTHDFVQPRPGLHTGGQPSRDDLARLQAEGVRTVIDLRAPQEDRGYDQAAEVRRLGMDYIALPANAAALHALLKERDGEVLLHCASGNRVGALLALAAVQVDGASPEAALTLGRAAGLKSLEPVVMERLAKPER
ncbi:MAG: sulfur transferase domain-containing protein [Pseudoxanthomonas sp.]|nr:sulfur transferase domain-containing protein [Pseudoxanthomonas sp.]